MSLALEDIALTPEVAKLAQVYATGWEEALRRARRRSIEAYFPDTGPLRRALYTQSLAFFAAGREHRLRLFLGGNRCITPWTPIETGHATRLAAEMLGEGVFDVRAWADGSRCTRQAGGVFLKGIEPAFRIHLDNGQSFDCTRRHRVLTCVGWLALGQLIHGASGLHCWQTVQDSPASYARDDCLCDGPLPWAVGSALARPRTTDDARPSCLVDAWRSDGVGHKSQYSQHWQGLGHRPILDDPDQIAGLCAEFQDPTAWLADKWCSQTRQAVRQWLVEYGPQQEATGVSRGQYLREARCDHAVHEYPAVGDTGLPGYEGSQDDGRCWQWKRPQQAMPGWWHDAPHMAIFFPYACVPLVGGQRIESIVKVGCQPIIDFTVEGVHCYESGGVIHHNTSKSVTGCYEDVLHLTGQYPPWWEGRRFAHPIRAWVCGTSDEKIKESVQELLLGPVGAWGTGLLPGDALVGTPERAASPIKDLVDTVRVQHCTNGVPDGVSLLQFKSYKQGRKAFEASFVDLVHDDEEVPLDIHTEQLLRTMDTTGTGARNGCLYVTFTPLEGLSDTVMEYLPDGQIPDGPQDGEKHVTLVGWDDVPHLSEATKAALRAAIPAYQLDARTRGIPMLGAGAIYPVPEADWLVDPFEIPPHWRRAYGLDVGWNRTAAIWGAYDPETDGWTLYYEHYVAEAQPTVHAAAIKAPGAWVPGVIDPAARGRSQADGEALLDLYQDLGLHLEPADNAVEAGIYQVWERLSTGRLKVFASLHNWRKEHKLYRRDPKGHVVKVADHLMDATRYLMLSGQQVARQVPVKREQQQPQGVAPGGAGWMA